MESKWDYKVEEENRNDKAEEERKEKGNDKELLFFELFMAFGYSNNIPLWF